MKLTYNLREAGQLVGLSKNTSYGPEFREVVGAVRIGRRFIVPAAKLAALLGMDTTELASRAASLANDNSEPSDARAA
jgi:hypothetical protein